MHDRQRNTSGYFINMGFALLILLFLASSCENFMDDALRKQMERDAAIAQSPLVKFHMEPARPEMGKIYPEGYNLLQKKDIPLEIRFSPERDYAFYRWAAFDTQKLEAAGIDPEAIEYENEEQYKEFAPFELDRDAVAFSNLRTEKTNLTFLKKSKANPPLIIPLCIPRPGILLSIPENNEKDVLTNSGILLVFSQPMDKKSLIDSKTLRLTENIRIYTRLSPIMDPEALSPIDDYFSQPRLESGGTVLSIPLKEDKITEMSRKNVLVRVMDTVQNTLGGGMKENHEISYTVHVDAKDEASPKIPLATDGPDYFTGISIGLDSTEFPADPAPVYFRDTDPWAQSGWDKKPLGVSLNSKLHLHVYAYDRIEDTDDDPYSHEINVKNITVRLKAEDGSSVSRIFPYTDNAVNKYSPPLLPVNPLQRGSALTLDFSEKPWKNLINSSANNNFFLIELIPRDRFGNIEEQNEDGYVSFFIFVDNSPPQAICEDAGEGNPGFPCWVKHRPSFDSYELMIFQGDTLSGSDRIQRRQKNQYSFDTSWSTGEFGLVLPMKENELGGIREIAIQGVRFPDDVNTIYNLAGISKESDDVEYLYRDALIRGQDFTAVYHQDRATSVIKLLKPEENAGKILNILVPILLPPNPAEGMEDVDSLEAFVTIKDYANQTGYQKEYEGENYPLYLHLERED